MKLLLVIFLIGTYSFITQATDDNNNNQKVIEFKPEEPVEEEVEAEDTVIPFLLNEVIPGFGSFESLVLSQKPSLSFRLTKEGLGLTSCALKAKVKQLNPIQYLISEADIEEFQVEADIGEPRWLALDVTCGDKNSIVSTQHFHISFSVTNEESQPSHYSIKIKTLGQEQLDLKLVSADVEVIIQSEERDMLLDPYGEIKEYSAELTPYKQKDIYLVPLSLWSPKNTSTQATANTQEDIKIELKKINVMQTIAFNGDVNLLFPTSIDGVKQDTSVTAPIDGTVYVTETNEYIPIINFSME